jgi:hypothetical protein
MAANAPPQWKQAGGLSLDMVLPAAGRKLVFTKVGGDPKLALAIRPQQSMRWGIGLLWSAIWVVIGLAVFGTLRHETAITQLMRLLPLAVSILCILGFCVLPGAFSVWAFAIFVTSALIISLRKPASAVTT